MFSKGEIMLTKRIKWLPILLPLLLLLVPVFSIVATPKTAHALTDGQQIEFVCPPQTDWIQISGYNQNGDYVTFEDDEGTSSAVWYISGWYWIGNVTIAYGQNGNSYIQGAYIPQVWPDVGVSSQIRMLPKKDSSLK
jgi:hypothetical protein